MKGKSVLKIITILCVGLIALSIPFVGACAPEAQPTQPTQTSQPTQPAKPLGELKVGIITPTTGPAAEKGAPMGAGNLDALKYVNDELGGVEGHKINVMWYDSGYDATNVVTQVNKLMDDGALLFTTSSSKEMTDAMGIANRAGFPGIACFTAPSLYRPPQHIYGQTPDYGDDAIAFTQFYVKNIWKGSGKPKFALQLLNNTTGYGARDAFKAKADELGIEIIDISEHAATTTSEMDALTRVKALKPDVLYISSTPAPTAIIIKNAKALGMYPGITIGSGHAGLTKALIDLGGADVVEGVYGAFPTVMWGDNVPLMAKMTEYVKKYNPKYEGNMDYITTWAQSLIVAEILRLAVKNAGYDILAKGDAKSWEAIENNGIYSLHNYDVGGLQGPVDYTTGDNRLGKLNRIYKIVNGKIGNPSDWVEAPIIKYEEYDWFGK